MSVTEIQNRIASANAEIARLNSQRNQNIGRREGLQKQLQDSINLYKEKYGVDLDVNNLQSELDRVTQEKEKELQRVEQILAHIRSGNIAEANRLAGVSGEDTTSGTVQHGVSGGFGIPTPPVTPDIPVPPTTSPVVPEQQTYTSDESNDLGMSALEGFTKPAFMSPPKMPTPPTPPTPPAPPAPPKPPTPPTPPSGVKPKAPMDFGAILNGTEFKI